MNRYDILLGKEPPVPEQRVVVPCPLPHPKGDVLVLPFQYGTNYPGGLREMRNRYRSLYHVDESVARTIDLLAERVVQNESV